MLHLGRDISFPNLTLLVNILNFGDLKIALSTTNIAIEHNKSYVQNIPKRKDTIIEVWTNKNSTTDTYVGHKNRSQSCHCVQQSLISFLAQCFSALVKAADV